MFEKKCKKCERKLKRSFDFCPHCGSPQKDPKSYGMLGKDDELTERIPENLMGNGLLNNMIGSAMKMIEREMAKTMQEQKPFVNEESEEINPDFKLFINGKRINPENIKVRRVKPRQKLQKQVRAQAPQIKKMFTLEQKEIFSKMEKETPQTNLRRLSDSIIYEIDMPGVKKITDVSIVKADKTIEVKALAENKAYFKILEVDYPVVGYNLQKEKLILELEIRE